MAVDMFLQLDGVAGESQDGSHKDQIDILSWSWGARQSGTGHVGGGAGAGKVEVQDLTITKYVDKSSPNIFFLCCQGKHIPKANLFVRKAGGEKPVEYVKIALEKVFVTAYQTGGTTDQDLITETVTLNFAKSKIEYVPQDGEGNPLPSLTKGWDVAANKEWS